MTNVVWDAVNAMQVRLHISRDVQAFAEHLSAPQEMQKGSLSQAVLVRTIDVSLSFLHHFQLIHFLLCFDCVPCARSM